MVVVCKRTLFYFATNSPGANLDARSAAVGRKPGWFSSAKAKTGKAGLVFDTASKGGEHAVRTTGHGAMRSIARPGWGFAKLHCPDRMSGLKFSKAEIYKIYLAAAIVFYNQHHNSLNSVEKI